MIDPSTFDAAGLQFLWSANSLDLAETCLYKYKLTKLDGWSRHTDSANLLFGGWYAQAIERFHRKLADGVDRDEALRQVVSETLIATWEYPGNAADTSERVDLSKGHPWTSDHSTKTRENLIRTIIWYVDHFNPDPLSPVILSTGPAVEQEFNFDLDNGLVWRGRIDRLVEYNGDIYVQDQKTTASTISPSYFRQYDLDNQCSGYAFAGRAVFNVPVRGVIIDAAQIAVGFSRFERGFTFRTESQLTEWYEHTLYYIHEARKATLDNYFPMNRTSCNKYGGCVFRDVCARSPEVRENFLKADFKKEPVNG